MRLESLFQPHFKERESTVTTKNKANAPDLQLRYVGAWQPFIRKQVDNLRYTLRYQSTELSVMA